MDTAVIERLNDVKARFDDASLRVLGPLRLSKVLEPAALHDLKAILTEVRTLIGAEEYVPRSFAGELWDLFVSRLADAEHAKDPTPIREQAWDIAEHLRLIFGPTW